MNQRTIHRPRRWDMPFSQDATVRSRMSEADIDRVLQTDAFRQIDPAGFKRSCTLRDILHNDVRIRSCRKGELIVRRGDWGNSAFYLLSGSVTVMLQRGDEAKRTRDTGNRQRTLFQAIAQLWNNHRHAEVRTSMASEQEHLSHVSLSDEAVVTAHPRSVKLEAGQWFGEVAALGRTPRVADIVADDHIDVLEIRWQGLRDLFRFDRHGALKAYLEDIFRERALASFLRTEPLFAAISDEELDAITRQCRLHTFGEYNAARPLRDASGDNLRDFSAEPIIAEQDSPVTAVHIVRSGIARLSQQHHDGRRTIGYLNPGRAHGMAESLLTCRTGRTIGFSARLSAIGYVNTVSVPIDVIADLLQRGVIHVPGPPGSTTETAPVKEHLLNFVVDSRFAQGAAAMVIDLDRCVRCDDCVQACAATHDGNPRFVRHGPIAGRHQFVNACLQCADPICMIECPTAAIHRDINSGLVLINESTCIGCAQCASLCSFDAIRMVETRHPDGTPIVDSAQLPILQATKCDLCHDQYAAPACQRACAHDALERVDLRDPSQLKGVMTR